MNKENNGTIIVTPEPTAAELVSQWIDDLAKELYIHVKKYADEHPLKISALPSTMGFVSTTIVRAQLERESLEFGVTMTSNAMRAVRDSQHPIMPPKTDGEGYA